ncbi:MAG: sugar phosphate nucleotidyltransferase [Candidatus Aenigmatarchaeota archaeon]
MFRHTPSFSVTGKKFNVIILASGLGMRLRPETEFIPKPLLPLDKYGTTSLDHLIQKFQYVAKRFVITTAYCADLLENYVKGKYGNALDVQFSRERVEDLHSPGRSVLFALDHVLIEYPTIIMFSDYVIEDYINVDNDALCVTQAPSDDHYIVDQFPKGIPDIDHGIVTDINPSKDLSTPIYGGWLGIGVFHNTLLLKALFYKHAIDKDMKIALDFDVVKDYVKQVKTVAHPVNKMFEFGVPEMLKKVRDYANANN